MNTENVEMMDEVNMKNKSRKRSKAKSAVMTPEFRMRVVGAKSGKGSYKRREKFVEKYHA